MDYTELWMCGMSSVGLGISSFEIDYPFLKWIMQRCNSSLEMDILESWIVNIFATLWIEHHIQVSWVNQEGS